MSIRWLVFAFALLAASCVEQTRFRASASRVEAQGVTLAIEPCDGAQQCDFLYEIANGSDHCVAISELSLPARTIAYLDSTLSLARRTTSQPSARTGQTWVVLQPGGSFRQGVDLRAITGIRDLTGSSLTLTTQFMGCSGFDHAEEAIELRSGAITFARE